MDVKIANTLVINQIKYFLDVVDEGAYTKPLELFSNATIGQHIRHVSDMYLCILTSPVPSEICYDKRNRDSHTEMDLGYATSVFEMIEKKLNNISLKNSIQLKTSLAADPYNDSFATIASTYERELMFAFDHAIHHLAMIRIAVQHYFPELILEVDFGVAPSTIHYKQNIEKQRKN